MWNVVFAAAVLGILGLLFGLALSYAEKRFRVNVDERIKKVRDCLGSANCGACGYPGCDSFAEAVVRGEAKPNACIPAGEKAVRAIAEIMGIAPEAVEEKKVPRVLCSGRDGVSFSRYNYDGYKSCAVADSLAGGPKMCRFSCVGLGDCMDHCVMGAIKMVDGLATINYNKCIACGECAKACPRGAIQMMPVSQSVYVKCRNTDNAREAKAVCMSACIGCGRCKRECKNDAISIIDFFAHIDPGKCVRCGACAQVCPSSSIQDLLNKMPRDIKRR